MREKIKNTNQRTDSYVKIKNIPTRKNVFVLMQGLKHAARQVHLCSPRTSQKLTTFSLFLRVFVNHGPQKLFSNKLRPVEHIFFGMWPSDWFIFETPVQMEGHTDGQSRKSIR